MSTNSTINIKHKDGSYEGIYCHWDGYPTWNGQLLYTFYNTPEKVNELISMGSLSSLGMNIGEKLPEGYSEANKFRTDHFQCRFYARDNGEDLQIYKDENGHYEVDTEEFNYLFDENDNEWYLVKDGTKTLLIDALRLDWQENGQYFEAIDKLDRDGDKTIGEICTPEQLERLAVLETEIQKPVTRQKAKDAVERD